jgi:hypothetical protein
LRRDRVLALEAKTEPQASGRGVTVYGATQGARVSMTFPDLGVGPYKVTGLVADAIRDLWNTRKGGRPVPEEFLKTREYIRGYLVFDPETHDGAIEHFSRLHSEEVELRRRFDQRWKELLALDQLFIAV